MTTICPDAGRLRSWLDRDDPDAGNVEALHGPSTAPIDDHLAECEACQATLAAIEHDAAIAARALGTPGRTAPTPAETETALNLLHRQLASNVIPLRDTARVDALPAGARFSAPASSAPRPDSPPSVPLSPVATTAGAPAPRSRRPRLSMVHGWQRWRLALGGVAAALAVTLALATPEGQAAAASFLSQFRSQRLAIVTFDPNQARQTGLFRFEQLGTVKNSLPNQPARPAEVANVQEAAGRAGFPIPQPDPATLPAGAAKTPKVRFSPASETRLTFDKQKARAYFDSIDRKDLALPDKMNGATLIVALPPVVLLEYAASDNKPAVMIGAAREIQVGVEGNASLDEIRTFLLGLPNVPPDLARQLRSIQDWTTTLPIPVPVDRTTWQETTIAGAPAYILNDNTGLGSGVIWQRDGRIVGVAGPMKANELRRIAESLK
jgi:hypothetical protein